MDIFNEASSLNHQGVNALLYGREDLAVRFFAASVTTMKRILTLSPVEPLPSTSIPQGKIGQDSNNNSRTIQLPPAMVYGQSQDESIMFNKAILIPNGHLQTQSALPQVMHQDRCVWTAAVVYNLAMAHHRKGKTVGLAVYTHKAEKLYTMALKILGEDDLVLNSNSIGVLVKLASINNLLDIRLESGDHVLAKECLSRVLSLLRFSGSASSDPSSQAASFQEADVQVLLLNLLLIQPPQGAPAAE